MKPSQKAKFRKLLLELGATELHHGDAIGADEEAHNMALDLNIPIVIHPPIDPKYRAFCKGYKEIWPEKPYLVRNEDIVNSSELMLGCPKGFSEELRSGTWHCLRYTWASNVPFTIILPNGEEAFDF